MSRRLLRFEWRRSWPDRKIRLGKRGAAMSKSAKSEGDGKRRGAGQLWLRLPDPAWAAPAAASADTLAAPRTPASSPPSAGRSQIAAPLPAGSPPPRTPPVAPERIAPRLSSPTLCPSRQKAIYCRIFTPAQPVYPAASLGIFSPALTLEIIKFAPEEVNNYICRRVAGPSSV
jgi:hypothetical protein